MSVSVSAQDQGVEESDENPSAQKVTSDSGSKMDSWYEERLANASSEAERFYLEECQVVSSARAKGDIEALAQSRDRLIDLSGRHDGTRFGAMAIAVAGDIESDLGRHSEARALYDQAAQAFRRLPQSASSNAYLPYLSERKGDAYFHEGLYDEAVESWRSNFLTHPKGPFIARMPLKARRAYSASLPKHEAWQASRAFYEEALAVCSERASVARFAVERLCLLFDGIEDSFITAAEFIEELESTLSEYPPDDNPVVQDALVALRDMERQAREIVARIAQQQPHGHLGQPELADLAMELVFAADEGQGESAPGAPGVTPTDALGASDSADERGPEATARRPGADVPETGRGSALVYVLAGCLVALVAGLAVYAKCKAETR